MGRVFPSIQRLYTWVRRPAAPALPAFAPPQEIHLTGIDERWPLALDLAQNGSVRVVESSAAHPPGLRLIARNPRSAEAHAALIRWLKRRAKNSLEPRLRQLAAELGFDYTRVRIGIQRTRWGSCSSRGTISLNAALLFLSPRLVDYVLIHELCHRRHLNHSPAFWRLLAEKCPRSVELAREARRARRHVPAWVVTPRRRRKRS